MKILRLEEVTDFSKLITRELTPEELAEVYRLGREAFTAADLQKYTEICEEIPAEDVLRELEELQQQYEQRNQ